MGLKQYIQKKLYDRCLEHYNEKLKDATLGYEYWCEVREGWKNFDYDDRDVLTLSFQEIFNEDSVSKKTNIGGFKISSQKYLLLYDNRGMLENKAAGFVADFFKKNPDVVLAYGDEDLIDESGKRDYPWFKADWAPDTFGYFNYFGHVFALRLELLYELGEGFENLREAYLAEKAHRQKLVEKQKLRQKQAEEAGEEEFIKASGEGVFKEIKWDYDLVSAYVYRFIAELVNIQLKKRFILSNDTVKEIAPLHTVLLHMNEDIEDIESRRIKNINLSYQDNFDEGFSESRLKLNRSGQSLNNIIKISAVIPNKDHPDVLYTCLSTLRNNTKLMSEGYIINLEIIVVDNGSSPENKAKIEEMAKKFDVIYHYEPMDFNFSKMCNIGARLATGGYILLLNNDMEIRKEEWLVRMLKTAAMAHVGAVGAKLLYPGEEKHIQHAGITNIPAGPMHKLMKLPDTDVYYHGRNRRVYDMIGVTAACILVNKDKYFEVGGFPEELAVAFNDVDFCFSLIDKGYYNVVRCDTYLIHHESLSRGDDKLDEKKWFRMLNEKERLYRRHESLRNNDFFFSPNLTKSTPWYIGVVEKENFRSEINRAKAAVPEKYTNEALIVNVEHTMIERRVVIDAPYDNYWIQGWSYVFGQDNCRYDRFLLLFGEKQNYQVKVESIYRGDVIDILPDETHIEMAGFVCRIPENEILPGNYRIGMFAKDGASKQRLFRMTDAVLEVYVPSVPVKLD